MTYREMYALLFEPRNGWRDQATLDSEFSHYERLRAKNGEVTAADLVHAFDQENARLRHIEALGEHLRANPRESDAYPDSSD